MHFKVVLYLLLLYFSYTWSASLNVGIYAGETAKIENYPYQLSLQVNQKHKCGATIINREWALTAAQCISGISQTSITLRSGSSDARTGGYVHTVSQIIPHKQYNSKTKDSDIALIKVANAFNIGKPGVNSVKLPAISEDIPGGRKADLTGYGLISSTAIPQYTLRVAKIPTIEKNACKKIIPTFTDQMACGGYTSGSSDACDGDQGTPLVLNGVLVGITSWNFSCGLNKMPIVFTKVSAFRAWIKDNTKI